VLEVLHYNLQYLVSDLDEQQEDDEHKQVVNNADGSDDDVDDLECKVMTLRARSRMLARYDVRSSGCCSEDVVKLFQTSLDDDTFSIAAIRCISCQPPQPMNLTTVMLFGCSHG